MPFSGQYFDLCNDIVRQASSQFDVIILDDITYAGQDQAESSVLFELIARRYETRSLVIAANQKFSSWDSAWDKVFPDQAVTVAATDRLVHDATILEMNGDSYRRRIAADRQSAKVHAGTTASNDNLETETSDNIKEKIPTNRSDRSSQNRAAWLSAPDKEVDASQPGARSHGPGSYCGLSVASVSLAGSAETAPSDCTRGWDGILRRLALRDLAAPAGAGTARNSARLNFGFMENMVIK